MTYLYPDIRHKGLTVEEVHIILTQGIVNGAVGSVAVRSERRIIIRSRAGGRPSGLGPVPPWQRVLAEVGVAGGGGGVPGLGAGRGPEHAPCGVLVEGEVGALGRPGPEAEMLALPRPGHARVLLGEGGVGVLDKQVIAKRG